MSKEQLKAFLEKVKGDLNLQERLKAAKSQDEVVSIAKEHGHDFGAEHISQLSEEELEGVAGGGIIGVDKATRADCRKTSDPESCQF
ncbi:Nif11-like leader peptide family natural product precursor [Synechococcus sp. RS9916]|uniref:Nif11-like leader peptide family natural product precursor n=1 Tax=Synechococcus sp. RS9916 TaxID=221359 RepID=UPI00030268C7|nr:Nif11-like leader peptide family natural product precursor [Synechococcus sp. RS9916]